MPVAENPPYISSPGTIASILAKIQVAQTPAKFDYDFLDKTLNLRGGSPKSFIPFAKRIGLLNPDGSPTELYKQFRGEGNQSKAIAQAMQKGYAELFARNEKAHALSPSELENLVIQVTGSEKGSTVVRLIVSCFTNLKKYADFSGVNGAKAPAEEEVEEPTTAAGGLGLGGKLNLSYTINLNLPETTDPAVFNAIFKSLKENLLRK